MAEVRTKHNASAKIVKALGMFSGVKILEIFCSLVRNKLIAWYIGPVGLGFTILYNSIVNLISQSSRLSIDQSAQRNITQASGKEVPIIIAVVRRWALWLGLSGCVLMCALSPLLSYWSFDTTDEWPVFCLLSIVPLAYTIYTCNTAENQGLRRFRAVVRSSVVATLGGLLLSVPLIFVLGIDSIPWIIVIYGVSTWIASWIFRPKVEKIKVTKRQTIEMGRGFIKLGAQITFALFVTQALNYFLVLYINTFASTEELGIYQAGYTIMNSYVGIVFSAMWIEYFPRLTAMAHSPKRLSISASHEVRVTLGLLTPLLCLLIILAKPVIYLIYSEDFLPIVPYIVLACVGVVLRVVSWCEAYVILARGDGKTYIITEVLSSVIGLGLNILGFMYWGFLGLGMAYILWYAVYTLMIVWVCKYRYNVNLNRQTWLMFMVAIALTSLICCVSMFL